MPGGSIRLHDRPGCAARPGAFCSQRSPRIKTKKQKAKTTHRRENDAGTDRAQTTDVTSWRNLQSIAGAGRFCILTFLKGFLFFVFPLTRHAKWKSSRTDGPAPAAGARARAPPQAQPAPTRPARARAPAVTRCGGRRPRPRARPRPPAGHAPRAGPPGGRRRPRATRPGPSETRAHESRPVGSAARTRPRRRSRAAERHPRGARGVSELNGEEPTRATARRSEYGLLSSRLIHGGKAHDFMPRALQHI